MSTVTQDEFEMFNKGTPYVRVSITQIRGSAPQVVGAKMLVTNGGLSSGTVGGGKIEAHCIGWAQSLLKNEKPQAEMHTWNLQTDIKMSCGGEVSIFFEPHVPDSWSVAIFGAGHISQELCRVLSTWNCHVNVYDTRQEWVKKLPHAPNIQANLVEDLALSAKSISSKSFVMSMTMGHSTDVPVLKEILSRDFEYPYVGVIGSDVKAKKIKHELKELGINDSRIEKLRCPMGLNIGDNTPPQIAISILAQLLKVKGELVVSQSN